MEGQTDGPGTGTKGEWIEWQSLDQVHIRLLSNHDIGRPRTRLKTENDSVSSISYFVYKVIF
jgi:hypothetical protein